nr:hypothetical protein [Paraburkholderia franconis]
MALVRKPALLPDGGETQLRMPQQMLCTFDAVCTQPPEWWCAHRNPESVNCRTGRPHACATSARRGYNCVIVITDNGAPKAVLQDVRLCEHLHRAVSLLEKLVSEHADVLTLNRAEIDSVLGQLRTVN